MNLEFLKLNDNFTLLDLEHKSFIGLDIKNEESKQRSESAKEGWRKYRINYMIGNIRGGIRTSLGLPKLQDNESFNYHK